MIESFFYILLAIIGLGILVFIHELGHYIMARRVGMKVEIFSIGFGKPIRSWKHKGVKWQICYIPFGGFVKIAGMAKENGKEPYEIPNGFYGKKPWDRIKVALAGPIVNIVFSLLIFSVIFITGGRQKPFYEYTSLIGWVDPQSELYHNGVMPGDEITTYNGEKFQGFRDLAYPSLLKGKDIEIEGYKIDYLDQEKTPYQYSLTPYENPRMQNTGFTTIGVLIPAAYLIYDEAAPLRGGSPMESSGIQYNDRIVWADGELVFSQHQLNYIVNQKTVLLTIKRGDTTFLGKVPRMPIGDMRLNRTEKAELDDWLYEVGLTGHVGDYLYLPYNLTRSLTVQNPVTYINNEAKEYYPDPSDLKPDSLNVILQHGDQILAVDGVAVSSAFDLVQEIQTQRVQMIVQRNDFEKELSWKDENTHFINDPQWENMRPIIHSLGTSTPLESSGEYHLLAPVTPIPHQDFPLTPEENAFLTNEFTHQMKQIKAIDDPEKKAHALRIFNQYHTRLLLGIDVQDRTVTYNPNPWTLFISVFDEIWKTLAGLFSGYLSPKYMAGPVGIMQVMQTSWSLGYKEALFWLGAISLNLGILNLLPIPVLDGGHICFSLVEVVRKKPMKSKTMEKFILPFLILIIIFFLYVTFNDLSRIFGRFFR